MCLSRIRINLITFGKRHGDSGWIMDDLAFIELTAPKGCRLNSYPDKEIEAAKFLEEKGVLLNETSLDTDGNPTTARSAR
jgi:hypothetical protein